MFNVIEQRPPPVPTRGPLVWLRKNLFSSPFNTVLTVVTGVIVAFSLYNLALFIFVDASWGQVWANMKLFGVYRYPFDLLWRPLTIVAVMMGLLGFMSGASGRGSIVANAFFAFVGLVALISVIAVIFWPSVRFLWPMVLVFAGAGERYRVFAVKHRPRQMPFELYHCPTPNVHPNGVICQGSVPFPVCANDTIEQALSLFLEGSLFNGDLAANKSRSYSEDVRQLWAQLESAMCFPVRELMQAHVGLDWRA